MNEVFSGSLYFGFFLSLFAYYLGIKIRKVFRLGIFNPLLVAIVLIIVFLSVTKIPYEEYNLGADCLTYFLTPATVCLALPLYRQIKILKQYWLPVLCGLVAGCAATMILVVGMCAFLQMESQLTVSLLPKSITTAIAIGVSEEIGGLSPVTVAAVVATGIIGAVTANGVFKVFRIKNPVAQGLALGASAHAIGTSRALEMGEIQGAISSLAIVVSGILTVAVAPVIAGLF